jgi:hypothetical protein
VKCDRHWYNDGRVELEGEEISARRWGQPYAEPFWRWWLTSDEAEAFRRERERLLRPLRGLFDTTQPMENSMHIHNVADYAPLGHKLLRTEYADGATRHVLGTPEGAELVCEVRAKDAAEEQAALAAFKAEWTPLVSTPVPAPVDPTDGGNADRDFQGNGQGLDEDEDA